MDNLNLLFNKRYYSKLGTEKYEKSIIEYNKRIGNYVFDPKAYKQSEVANISFVMKICYPGLLIGTGNPHGVGKKLGEELDKKSDNKSDKESGKLFSCDDDINCGFSFDYTSGQPYIPGSSVKGVLRSHFKEHPQAVADVLKNNGVECDTEFVKALEKDIFDNEDVFLDAVIYDGDKHGNVVGFDYITPHESPLKDPIPIHIIKVLPDVKIEFRFRLSDHTIGDKTITGGKLKWIFLELLALFGIGAKTNVGYGVLEKSDESRSVKELRQVNNSAANQSTNQRRDNNYRNNNRNNNAGGSNGDKIQCPHCHKYISRINKYDGKPNKICYLCKEKLF